MGRVAFVLADDFEDSEFRVPYDRLIEEGHVVTVVGRTAGKAVTGKRGKETVTPTASADTVSAADFDALVIPGGYSPDKLRMDEGIVKFVKGFFGSDKPVAAICHGGSLLVEADAVEGRTVTSWPSVRTDLVNAGAEWVDEEVVVDGSLVTSRQPEDLPAFTEAILDKLDATRRMPADV
ncbi:MAG TPA: type 1 glutamine amidotransferase domain-containing protein [Acidimicrobiales bacterium]|nr:type 1 glutamine amidotransferase domain-containing protein [Acidimicrobiales bacterium]